MVTDVVVEQIQKFDSQRQKGSAIVKQDFHFNYPVKGLFFNAVNKTAEDWNHYSNYTTDAHDADVGFDPISRVSQYYDGVVKYENLPSDHFCLTEPYYSTLPRVTMQTGYHYTGYALDILSSDGTGSTNYAKLQVTMQYDIQDGDRDEDDPRPANGYAVILRLVTSNIIRYEGATIGFPTFN
jgi:hypothetical protein